MMADGRPNPRSVALVACAAIALAFGAWTSFHYVFGAWRPDPDIYVTVELWRGVHRYGLKFLSTWSYTQDNWLFSLIPFSSLAFEVFGGRPEVAVAIGWAIFLLSVALTGWLAARLAGWRAGLILAAVLIFAGLPAIGGAGYLGYPISHNLSMAWVLLTLVLAVHALERGSWAACAGVGLLVFINTVSDPWAAVAIAIPLLLAAGGLAVAYRGERSGRGALGLALASAIALIVARTRLFGLLDFLPETHFEMAEFPRMLVNFYWGSKSLAAMFDILPGPAGSETAGLINLAALGLVFGAAAWLSLRGFRQAGAARQLIFAVSVLSIGATLALYLVGQYDGTLAAGRFFANVYYLGALGVAVAAADRWRRWRLAPKLALGAYATLFVVAGLTSAPQLWTGRAPPPPKDQALDLAAFLQGQSLSYGYGVFWGTRALVLDTVTNGRVIIRPVSLMDDHVRRRPAQTSSLWYLPSDEPAPGRRFLVIRDDGEECPSVDVCVAVAKRQLGPPSEQYFWRDAVILVWPGSIAARIDP